jgi:hypothetical protein
MRTERDVYKRISTYTYPLKRQGHDRPRAVRMWLHIIPARVAHDAYPASPRLVPALRCSKLLEILLIPVSADVPRITGSTHVCTSAVHGLRPDHEQGLEDRSGHHEAGCV